MKKSNVAAVVVTFNRIALVMKCLSALQTQTIPCDILLVDNASTDGKAQEVHKLLGEQVQYRNTGTNLGGAGGFHYGMCWAIEAGYDYVWVMDDDCAPQPNALKELLDGRYGFLCSAVLWTDGNACMMNRQKVKKLLKFSAVAEAWHCSARASHLCQPSDSGFRYPAGRATDPEIFHLG